VCLTAQAQTSAASSPAEPASYVSVFAGSPSRPTYPFRLSFSEAESALRGHTVVMHFSDGDERWELQTGGHLVGKSRLASELGTVQVSGKWYVNAAGSLCFDALRAVRCRAIWNTPDGYKVGGPEATLAPLSILP
jgi:hypothetical protein